MAKSGEKFFIDDCTEHYEYFKDHFNPNPHDCCNLRKHEGVNGVDYWRIEKQN